MIRLACKIPKKVTLACSGGKDSMAVLSFLLRGKRDVSVAYYNHGTDHGHEAQRFVQSVCDLHRLELITETCNDSIPKKVSKEEFWRNKRYEFFKKARGPIITAHHLDDAVEWWIFSSLRGNPSLMPIKRDMPHVIRPFMLSLKKDLHRHLNMSYIQDPSNTNVKFARNYIRHELAPMCLTVNPGLHKTVRNLYQKADFNEEG